MKDEREDEIRYNEFNHSFDHQRKYMKKDQNHSIKVKIKVINNRKKSKN
jgi:hypothetical protein